MKKAFFISILAVLMTACGAFKTINTVQLAPGITKDKVISKYGKPKRVLAVYRTDEGCREVLEYIDRRSDVYALEFLEGNLLGFYFLYDALNPVPTCVPPPASSAVYAEPGRVYLYNNVSTSYYTTPQQKISSEMKPAPTTPTTPVVPTTPTTPTTPVVDGNI